MPTAREWRQRDLDRADAELIGRAAIWLRDNPDRAGYAGLARDGDAHALAVLLDVLAAELPYLDSAVRWQTVEACHVLLGEPMADPHKRRTRRR
jgi:hypothetical protein